jgi:MFS family permease
MTARNVAGAHASHAGEELQLTRGTLYAGILAVGVAQLALAIPAVLQGLFTKDLGATSSQLTWISDAFLVPVTLLELTFGVLGDLFGRKRLLVIGAALLVVGMGVGILTPGLSSSTSTRVTILWIAMALSGAGAAAIMPTSLAMLAAETHTAEARARAITLWAAALSAGNMLSPVLGGWLAGFKWGSDPNASWRWGLVAVALLSLISVFVSAFFAGNSSSPEGRSLDWPGQITVGVAIFALLFAVIQGPTSGWGSPLVIGGFIVGLVFLGLFIVAENRAAAPLLLLSLFKNRAFGIGSIATVIGMFAFLGTAYSTSIRLTVVLGWTPLHAALAFLLFNGLALPMIPLTSRLLHNYNPRWTMGAGLALTAAGDLWTAAVPVSSQTGIGQVVAPYALVGIGFALSVSAMTAVLVDTVPNHLEGMASGAANMLRDFGFTLGPAIIAAVTLSRAASNIHAKLASTPSLSKALAGLNAAAAHTPALKPVAGAVNSGPLGAVAIPDPPNPIQHVAFLAMGSANGLGYLICGIAGLVAVLLVVFGIGGGARDAMISEESLGERPAGIYGS